MRPIGFSTGAIAYSDFNRALAALKTLPVQCVELSALRLHELKSLLDSVGQLNLTRYQYISFHAPSNFTAAEEEALVAELRNRLPRHWPIIVHPDTIHKPALWREFGQQLAIENMDRRKPCGRTVEELSCVFDMLPEATFCFDIGHARQYDTSMTEAYEMLRKFRRRLRQLHVSEVNTLSQHDPVSYVAKVAFQQVSRLIPESVPVIIESRVSHDEIAREITRVREALPVSAGQLICSSPVALASI